MFANAQAMLKRLVDEKWLTAKAVYGLFPANACGDDVILYTDDTRQQVLDTLSFIRQQSPHASGKPNYC